MYFERGKAAPKQRGGSTGRPAWDATCDRVCGGMMKRKILEKLFGIKKKIALTVLLAGFAAINAGFTEVTVPANEPAQPSANIESTTNAVYENVVETLEGSLPYSQMMSMEATAYLPTDGSPEGLTAMGIPARWGIVAVDPDVIPLGTKVYIPGYGVALAADVGGAINGYKIDLCMEDYNQAMDFGRRTVTVFVLK